MAKRMMITKRIETLMLSKDIITPKDRLAMALQAAWAGYVELFGEQPHGTLPQMKALVAFVPDSFIGEPAKPGITISPQSDASAERG
jgi:hypothetical protein